MHGRLLQKYSKVKSGSWERSTKHGMGIIHSLFIQNAPFTVKLTLKFGHKWPIPGLLWPKSHVHILLQTAAEAFRSQNWFTSKNNNDWDGNVTWHFKSTTTLSVKLTSNFGQKRPAPWLILPKWHVKMVVDYCRSISKSSLVHEQGFQDWDRNLTWPFHANTPFSPSQPSNLGKNGQFESHSGPNRMAAWI